MFKLTATPHLIISNLKRKDKVGTIFSADNPASGAKGYAVLVGSKKNGTRIGEFQHSGQRFEFHTDNKTQWPNAFNPIGYKA